MAAPGKKEGNIDDTLLEPKEASKYRAMAARRNYLGQDRSDIQFAVKELSIGMSNPTKGGWSKLKRLARYLIDKTRVVTTYEYQEELTRITIYSDSDFAGCNRTRKSMPGGLVMYGKCLIKTWSSTQSMIALSSGESEYYGLVKAASQGIGMRHLFEDLGGVKAKVVQIMSDASAAIGIASRRGSGNVRHIEFNQLWLQDKVMINEVEVTKIRTDQNPADALTKHVEWEGIHKHGRHVGSRYEDGRHEDMPRAADEDVWDVENED